MSTVINPDEHDSRLFMQRFYLAAGEAGPEQTLPLALLTARLIEVATNHSNALGVGYENLMAHGQAWVLSRVAVEMTAYPRVDTHYCVGTWVESIHSHFSARNFVIADGAGVPMGYARTIWVGINVAERTLADISRLEQLHGVDMPEMECPIAETSRHRPVREPQRAATYTFQYSDIDSNRHVNTVRYLELVMNQWPLSFHSLHPVRRLEMSFMHESYFGEVATVALAESAGGMHASVDIAADSRLRSHFELDFG